MSEIDLMTEDRPESLPSPGRMGPLSFLLLTLASIVMVLAVVGYLRTAPDEGPDDMPADIPPSPSSTWSDECTAEDLDDGACYTWDDIRDQPTYSQGPDGPVLVTP